MEYILFIHKNVDSEIPKDEWDSFFKFAREQGVFQGGSEIRNRKQLGKKNVQDVTSSIGGFMQFNTENTALLNTVLEKHPVTRHGGTLELCELPKT